jgi:hypothetical protein
MAELSEDTIAILERFVEIIKDFGEVGSESIESITRHADAASDAAGSFDELSIATDSVTESQNGYKKAGDAVNEVVDGTAKAFSGMATATAAMTKAFSEGGESLSTMSAFITPIKGIIETSFGLMGSLAEGLMNGMSGLLSYVPLIGDMLGNFMDGLGGMVKGLSDTMGKVLSGVVGALGEALISALEKAISMFKGTTDAGLLFSGGMLTMVSQMNDLSLFQDEYIAVVKNNAAALTLFGGTVAEGMNKLTDVMGNFDSEITRAGKSVRSHRDELYNMGIGYQEQTENVVDYMTQLTITGNLQKLTAEQIAEGSYEYMKNLKVISALTGKTASEMKAERDDALSNLAFRNKLSKLDVDQQEAIMAAQANIPKEGQKAFKEAIVFGKVMTDVGAIATGMSIHYETLAHDLVSGTANAKDATIAFYESIRQDMPRLEQAFQSFDAAGQAALVGAGSAITDQLQESVMGQIMTVARAGEFTREKYDAAVGAGLATGAAGLETFFADIRKTYGAIAESLVANSEPILTVMTDFTSGISSMFDRLNKAVTGKDGIENFKPLEFIMNEVKTLFGIEKGKGVMAGLTESIASSLGLSGFLEGVTATFASIQLTIETAFIRISEVVEQVSKAVTGFTDSFLGGMLGGGDNKPTAQDMEARTRSLSRNRNMQQPNVITPVVAEVKQLMAVAESNRPDFTPMADNEKEKLQKKKIEQLEVALRKLEQDRDEIGPVPAGRQGKLKQGEINTNTRDQDRLLQAIAALTAQVKKTGNETRNAIDSQN